MDLRGIPEDFINEVEFDDRMCGVFTASPGVIESFDGKVATVKMSVRLKYIQDGKVKHLDPPLITNVPVVLPQSMGAGVYLTIPIKKGDPCLLVFGQRGIDNVVNMGGVQNPPDTGNALSSRIRHHDMSDAICIPGLCCKPSAPAAWATDGIEIRNAAGTASVKVTAATIESKGIWNHTGVLTVNGRTVVGV
jgi:hypothetical protein